MRVFLSTLLIALLLLFYTNNSDADVLIEAGAIDFFTTPFGPTINQLDAPSGPGQAGDYLLLVCLALNSSVLNTFSAPDPAIFTELQAGDCVGVPSCIYGIWGGITANPASEDLFCNTAQQQVLFTIGTLRYSNVFNPDPVIDFQCNEGMSNTATAPSIVTEAGSQVARIFTSFAFLDSSINNIVVNPLTANFSSESDVDGNQISSIVDSMLFNSAGPTGTADQVYAGVVRNWRACTLALRMVPDPPTDPPPTITPTPSPTILPIRENVPTLSQWGHLSVAILALVVGIWFLRRKKAKV